jgi:ubiquinone/menaquinone biosynthesis C-methylase UbiE
MRKVTKILQIGIISTSLFLAIWIQVVSAHQTKDLAEPVEIEFNEWQPPEQIMNAVGLKAGMVIGEIGAGGGRFTVWFADRVGEGGTVYANDIDIGALLHLKKRCEKHNFANVIPRIGRDTDPNFPAGVLDFAFMIGTYHHLDKPVELIRNIIPTLKPNGILVIVENDPEKSGWTSHTTSKNILIEQVGQAGLDLVKIDTFLRRDNIYYFQPKKLMRK